MKYSTTSMAFSDRYYSHKGSGESRYTSLLVGAIINRPHTFDLDRMRDSLEIFRKQEIKQRGMIRVNLRANVSIYRAIKIAKSSARHNTLLTYNYND